MNPGTPFGDFLAIQQAYNENRQRRASSRDDPRDRALASLRKAYDEWLDDQIDPIELGDAVRFYLEQVQP